MFRTRSPVVRPGTQFNETLNTLAECATWRRSENCVVRQITSADSSGLPRLEDAGGSGPARLPGWSANRARTAGNYSCPVLGISGDDASYREDDGAADPDVTAALGAFGSGTGSEREALAALATCRLLVPVLAVLAAESGSPDSQKSSAMAMPTLIGLDGRRAIPAFTCVDSMRRWRDAARPVPAAAQRVWQAAAADSCAVVIDVAGPVRLAVEGARLAALAGGTPLPAAWADPDVREVVSDVLAGELAVAAFELFPGDPDCDLAIALTLAPGSAGRDVSALAAEIGGAVMTRLGVRLRRGVAVRLGAGR